MWSQTHIHGVIMYHGYICTNQSHSQVLSPTLRAPCTVCYGALCVSISNEYTVRYHKINCLLLLSLYYIGQICFSDIIDCTNIMHVTLLYCDIYCVNSYVA